MTGQRVKAITRSTLVPIGFVIAAVCGTWHVAGRVLATEAAVVRHEAAIEAGNKSMIEMGLAIARIDENVKALLKAKLKPKG